MSTDHAEQIRELEEKWNKAQETLAQARKDMDEYSWQITALRWPQEGTTEAALRKQLEEVQVAQRTCEGKLAWERQEELIAAERVKRATDEVEEVRSRITQLVDTSMRLCRREKELLAHLGVLPKQEEKP